MRLRWFCLKGKQENWFVEQSLCNVARQGDSIVYRCCSNYNLCNTDLEDNISTTVSVDHYTSAQNDVTTNSMTLLLLGLPVLLMIILVIVIIRMIRVKKHRTKDDNPADTITSGSGLGKPYLVRRTVARKINLGDIVLGCGRFGKVCLGYYQKEAVAVKRFASSEVDSWAHETRVFDLCLHHEAIVGFIASDLYCLDASNERWLVTSYHPNGSLFDFLRGCGTNEEGEQRPASTLSVIGLLKMAASVCSGLAHLHTPVIGYRGKPPIAHRDVKSANVLVKADLTCCLADMGLAFVGAEMTDCPPPPSFSRHSDMGTRRYMAPEILSAGPHPHMNVQSQVFYYMRADVYAVGLVIWEMCRSTVTEEGDYESYAPPYEGMVPLDPSLEDMKKVVCGQNKRPPISERWHKNQVMSKVAELIQECWRGNPYARPSSLYLKYALLNLSKSYSTSKPATV